MIYNILLFRGAHGVMVIVVKNEIQIFTHHLWVNRRANYVWQPVQEKENSELNFAKNLILCQIRVTELSALAERAVTSSYLPLT